MAVVGMRGSLAVWCFAAVAAAVPLVWPARAPASAVAATPVPPGAGASGPVVSGRVATPDGVAASSVRVVLLPQVTDYERARLALDGRALPAPVARARAAADGGYSLTAPGVGVYDDAGLVTVEVRADDGTRFQEPDWGGQLQSRWRLGFGRTIEGLPAGTWTVHASTADGRSWQRRLTVAAGATHRVVLE